MLYGDYSDNSENYKIKKNIIIEKYFLNGSLINSKTEHVNKIYYSAKE